MPDHDLAAPESEAELIAAAMAWPDDCAPAFTSVLPQHFSDGVHGLIWSVIMEMVRAGARPIPTMIRDKIGSNADFQAWGGFDLLYSLWDKGSSVGLAEHVAAVLDRAGRRALVGLGRELIDRAGDIANHELAALITSADRSLATITEDAAPDDAYLVDAPEAIDQALDHMDQIATEGRPRGLLTGLRCFDYRCRGLQPGWLIVLAGRPSMGKTAIARSAAMSAALRNPAHRFVYFALEMDREELSHRTLSELSYMSLGGVKAIPYFDMLGVLSSDQRATLRSMKGRSPRNFSIIDAPVISVDYIRRRLYALKRRGPIGAVFIDYLQIMKRPGADGRNEASVIGEMTAALKRLARELGICIVLLSQLSRAVENREDKVPQMSDLRESGAIEQDANAILLAYREFYYVSKNEPKGHSSTLEYKTWLDRCEETRRSLDVIIPKVRAGPSGRDRQSYWAEFDHIEDPFDGAVAQGGAA